MRFLFQRCDNSVKAFHVGAAHTINDCPFQRDQVTIDAPRDFSPLCRECDNKAATIGLSYFARDQATTRETIENAG